MEIIYTLEDFTAIEKERATIEEKQEVAFFAHRKNEPIKQQQHYAFAPTVDKMKKEDHQRMLQQGRSLMHSSS